jgi:hypothetical protein
MESQQIAKESNWRENKFLAVIEVTIAILFIVAANLFHILPISETPYIFLFAWLMLRLRGYKWSSVGMMKPENWLRTIAIAIVTAIFLQLLSSFVTEPLITRFTHQPTDLSKFKPLVGNTKLFVIYLLVIWTLAAFGEELVYRGYIMNRIADIGNRASYAWGISLLLVSVLFGLSHSYQGITGIIDTGVTSLVLGSLYFYTGRNLWALILAHGFSDTIALLIVYFNLIKL